MDTALTVQQFYTISETEKILRLSRTALYFKIKSGKIPSVKIGKRVLVPGIYFEKLKNQAMEAVL